MKTLDVSSLPGGVALGRQGENEAEKIAFTFSSWQNEFGVGTITLLLRRPGETVVYPVALDVSGTTAVWTVSGTDTAIAGNGQADLVYTVGDQVKKSACFYTLIDRALTGTTKTAPPPYNGYVEQVLAAAQHAANAASDAAGNAELAGNAAAEAGTARDDACAARNAAADYAAAAFRNAAQSMREMLIFADPEATGNIAISIREDNHNGEQAFAQRTVPGAY